jgi:peroxiredoxin Q/BCP
MKTRLLTALFLTLIAPMSLFADKALQPGAEAPRLAVTTHTGETMDLGQLYDNGPVLVYFYPKSDTPGCTRQACNLRDNFADLEDAGVQVVGVSSDSVKAQQAFREKYSLPFTLVADEDKALGKAFGVGSIMGMAYKRQSFLIIDGKIAWRDLSASPDSQTADALAALKSR